MVGNRALDRTDELLMDDAEPAGGNEGLSQDAEYAGDGAADLVPLPPARSRPLAGLWLHLHARAGTAELPSWLARTTSCFITPSASSRLSYLYLAGFLKLLIGPSINY